MVRFWHRLFLGLDSTVKRPKCNGLPSGLGPELDYEVLKFIETRDGVPDILAVARMNEEGVVDQSFGLDGREFRLTGH